MKSVAITGHTAGIGKGLADRMSSEGWQVYGYSRSTNHDLTLASLRISMFHHLKFRDPDVFVNNAYLENHSVDVLYGIFHMWRDKPDKIILNISSVAGEYDVNYIKPYNIWKNAIDKAVLQCQRSDHQCRVVNARFGYVDTRAVESVDAPKLTVEDVVDKLMWILEQPAHIYLQDLKFVVRDGNPTI